jgi:hypothetical protein
VRTFATSGNWVDTNCGSNNSATTFGTNGNNTSQRQGLDEGRLQQPAMNDKRHALFAHFGSLRSTLALLGLLAAVVLGGSVSGTPFGAGVAMVIAC